MIIRLGPPLGICHKRDETQICLYIYIYVFVVYKDIIAFTTNDRVQVQVSVGYKWDK